MPTPPKQPNPPDPPRKPGQPAPKGTNRRRQASRRPDLANPCRARGSRPQRAKGIPNQAGRFQLRAGGRGIGQVLVDLGFIDQEQVWDIVEEAKVTEQRTGQVAIGRGLIGENQLLQALAEQHGLKSSTWVK